MKQRFIYFLRHVRIGYLLFTSILILGAVFGLFEIIEKVLFTNLSENTLRWLFITRGVTASLFLMIWAAWTVYKYRSIYEEKLQVTESRYRDIIEHSADAIMFINQDNRIRSWNSGAEQIFGWKKEEVIGKSIELLVPDDLLEMDELECIKFGMKYRGYVRNYETERLHKNGKRILVNLTESFIRDENDEIVGRSQILRDLTDIKVREEQVRHSERLAAVGHIAAGVAHEVGNPLAAISSLAQISQRKTDDPFIQSQLSKVRTHIQRINKIVRDLVDFSRPASLDVERADVNEIVKSSVGLLKHDARCREVDFKMDLSADMSRIECVPDHLHQVLVNLLLNAVDAMDNIENPEVTIKTYEQNRQINIDVSDIGKGIKEEDISRIFEPFFTTKEVGAGTGLGLSVSHGIITKMGGTISVDTEYGEGSTFKIDIPVNSEVHERIDTNSR